MDHDRRAALLEQRIRLVLLQGHIGVDHRGRDLAVGRNAQIPHVAGVVAFPVPQAVLLLLRIEVRTRGSERRLAFADGVDVKGMLAGRQVLERQPQPDTGLGLRQRHGADVLAIRIDQDAFAVKAAALRAGAAYCSLPAAANGSAVGACQPGSPAPRECPGVAAARNEELPRT